MDNLSSLKIDRTASASRRPKSRRWWYLGIGVLVIAVAVLWLRHAGEIAVESTGVTAAYPYQGVTLLNATGYVVAQRKAAIATKATGRLEWLGVQEGSVVKAGEVIARLESADVSATSEQAAASVLSAKAELDNARVDLDRAREWGGASKSVLIEGELVAKSSTASGFTRGARVFHLKFGNGTVILVDGNKLTVEFDKAGRKMVLENFVNAV